ncbi:MAG: glycosyltransferase family 4 protein [Bacteroidetes bacterium]|nr:glycosyltransferase family 4 protein [Bacteroidota bacterium]
MFIHTPLDDHSEAFGQVYIEALAAGIPSVFSKSGIANEFIIDQKNALVVDHQNEEQIVAAVKRILNDDELRSELISNGREDVKTKFDLPVMINALEELYNN